MDHWGSSSLRVCVNRRPFLNVFRSATDSWWWYGSYWIKHAQDVVLATRACQTTLDRHCNVKTVARITYWYLVRAFVLKAPYCGSVIGSNEQGDYCREVLGWFNCLNRDINDLLYFTLLLLFLNDGQSINHYNVLRYNTDSVTMVTMWLKSWIPNSQFLVDWPEMDIDITTVVNRTYVVLNELVSVRASPLGPQLN